MKESEIPGILVAMPSLDETFFEKSIILLCSYNAEGAFGLIMNRPSLNKVKEIIYPESNPLLNLCIVAPTYSGFWSYIAQKLHEEPL